MRFNWTWNESRTLMQLRPALPDKDVHAYGWVEVLGKGYDGTGITRYHVWISTNLTKASMPCEEEEYVSLRKAMRALRTTVIVLLIGRKYGV